MKTIVIATVLLSFCFACNKTGTTKTPIQDSTLSLICYKAKYLQTGCWPVVQILSPLEDRFKHSGYRSRNGMNYQYAVGVGALPDKYKNGLPFYFTVAKIDSNLVYNPTCIPTKYYFITNSFTDSTGKTSEKQYN